MAFGLSHAPAVTDVLTRRLHAQSDMSDYSPYQLWDKPHS
jgi:hypothetical protein